MNEETNNTIQKIKEAQKIIEDSKKNLQSIFKKELTELLNKYKTVKNINTGLNNHSFNDGGPTYFSVYYEDLTITFEDEIENEIEYDGYGEVKPENKKIREEFVNLFKIFNVDNFYETMFGDKYDESLDFRLNNENLVIQ